MGDFLKQTYYELELRKEKEQLKKRAKEIADNAIKQIKNGEKK